ncbi:peptidoglycan bridge formation glycyltransferase FemA/FemB family protein [Candidatus Gottesmanbacteria bacterium]|nr:peptidoglycan bridge formation glycyltransferase FemA/FemB family protein [Candidatus Gottesmanbacteria bacterium]
MKLHIEEIVSRPVWETFVGKYASRALFQTWLWGEVIKQQGIALWRFGLFDGRSLAGVVQVAKVRARRGTYLHVRHGPVFRLQRLSYWRSVLTHLSSFARTERAWFLRVSPYIDDSPEHRLLLRGLSLRPSVLHEVDGERCLLLSLDQTEEEILARMRKSTRYEVRRAEKMGLRIMHSTDPNDLDGFFRLYQETSKRQRFVPHKGIREEFALYAAEGNAVLVLGYDQQILLSAAIILFSEHQAIYHHGASIPGKLPVNYAVQWEAIRMAKKRGMRWYNFWGVSPEGDQSHPWYGHSLFKRGFGGTEVTLIHAYDLPLSPWCWLTRGFEWIEERMRGY